MVLRDLMLFRSSCLMSRRGLILRCSMVVARDLVRLRGRMLRRSLMLLRELNVCHGLMVGPRANATTRFDALRGRMLRHSLRVVSGLVLLCGLEPLCDPMILRSLVMSTVWCNVATWCYFAA